MVTSEKDVLVRHSAHQVHIEAELSNAKRGGACTS
jgi:hypothetical protein